MAKEFKSVGLGNLVRGTHFRAQVLRGDAMGKPIDPFLGVDHAWSSGPTFPPHPHAGFSAVSYVFEDSDTGILNRDSLGTRNLIEPGGLHWTTAGRGVVHEEVPAETGKMNHMLQIFVNLAADRQQIAPYTLSLQPADVPVVHLPGVRIRIPLGRLLGHASPLTPPTDVCLFDISLEDGAHLELPIPVGATSFVMPIRGQLSVDGEDFDSGGASIPVFEAVDRSRNVRLVAVEGRTQAVFFAGIPFRQPVHWQASMAMASPVALLRATAEFKMGKFGTVD